MARIRITLALAAFVFISLFLAGGCKTTKPRERPPTVDSKSNPVFKRTPPVATRAGVRLLERATQEGNALLEVEFGRGEEPGSTVVIQLEDRPVVLRDDGRGRDERAGDRLFTGIARVDPDELARQQEKLVDLAQRNQPVPVFNRRQLVGEVTLRRVDAERREIKSLLDIPRFDPREPRQFREFPIVATRPRPGDLIPLSPLVDPSDVDPVRSLMINDPSVVEDPARTFNPCTSAGNPNGVWTFGHLMTQMANTPVTGISAADFTRRWLRRWEIDQTVNDFSVPNRQAGIRARIINSWLAASGGTTLDLTKAPFRLLAIVNRVDLRENLLYGGGSAGEARFVFGAVDLASGCSSQQMTVIFEYGIIKSNCSTLRNWGQQWFDLKNHPLGSAAYNTALQAITDQFVTAGANPGQLPNRSALSQLRTNEIALAGPWELREFRLATDDSDIGHLRQVTVKQTPADDFNQTAAVASYINANAAAILAGKHVVPIDFPPGTPFLGGASQVPPNFWDGPPPSPSAAVTTAETRHLFSLSTCNGCHFAETSTGFLHVRPSDRGLSGFLTGITVNDPAGEMVGPNPKQRSFNDLLRRQTDLAGLVNQACFRQLFFDPIRMVH